MGCVNCGWKKLDRTISKRTREIGGRVFTADLPARTCGRCGNAYFEARDVQKWEREIVRDLVQHGPATSESLAFIRRGSGFKAVEMAALLDVTPQAVSRWENGKAPFDRPTWIAIGRLAIDRIDGKSETVDLIHALTKRPARRVHIKLNAA